MLRPRQPDEASAIARLLSDFELATRVRQGVLAEPGVIDEYYRRCIPIYQEFLGRHWHTGWYEEGAEPPNPSDQERMIAVIAQSAGIAPGMRVLDVGCGIGATAHWLAHHRQAEVVGLTPVAEQKQIADRFLASTSLTRTPVIVLGRGEQLPFPEASFDAVVFFESTCHIEQRAAFIREAHRVLRPGGRLAGEDWLRIDGPDEIAQAKLVTQVERLWAIPRLGRPSDYLSLMEAAGFKGSEFHDLREESALARGFATTASQQRSLESEIAACREPLLGLILEGLLALGRAFAAGCFTVGRFSSKRPGRI